MAKNSLLFLYCSYQSYSWLASPGPVWQSLATIRESTKETRLRKKSPRINKAKQKGIARSLKRSDRPLSMINHFRHTLTM